MQNGWLFCNSDWDELIDVIKSEKNAKKRLQIFHKIIKKENLDKEDIIDIWLVANNKKDIKEYTDDMVRDDFIENEKTHFNYWFFNIYTGEALHVNYIINWDVKIITD